MVVLADLIKRLEHLDALTCQLTKEILATKDGRDPFLFIKRQNS